MNSHRSTLPALLLFIIVFVGGIFYTKPLWDDVTSLGTGRDQQQAQKETLTKQLQDLQNLQQTLNNGSEIGKQTTLQAIPERFEQDVLIADLTSIAQKNDVLLKAVNFNLSNAATNTIKRATINVDLTGDDSHLISFLKGIESNGRKIVVKSITVQASKVVEGETPRVNFTLSMETYYQDRI